MAKNKKISFNMIAANIVEDAAPIVLFNGKNQEFSFTVKRMLNLEESIGFVNDVVDTCVDLDTGLFRPELADFAVRVFTLVYFAGMVFPTNLEKANEVVYGTELYEKVVSNIYEAQYDVLLEAIRNKISHVSKMLVSSQTSLMNTLIHKMDEMMDENEKIMKTINTSEFQEQIQHLINLSNNDIISSDDSIEKLSAETQDNVIVLPSIK